MKIYRSLRDYEAGPSPVVTLGTFDGVHPGHQAILRRVLAAAHRLQGEAVVITFHPHPRKILPHSTAPGLLSTLQEKEEKLRELGIHKLLVIPFTQDFSQLEPADFVQAVLLNAVRAQRVVVGYDHRFGKNRTGDLALLERIAAEKGFAVEEIPAQEIDHAKVSSTRIREALLTGQVAIAQRLLGYAYSLQATVVHGDKRGRQLGWPTANLLPTSPEKLLPATGVYAVRVHYHHHAYLGMMNIGTRPTVDGLNLVPEVHLLNFEGDLYGQQLQVDFIDRIRDERKFHSLEELKAQLAADAEQARRMMDGPR
ncbi:MAG: bifunctional riboflavin kinase/FAD synthetase [Bacteroidetes bacterium]|nr:bifunctional riboflavin kinase/FAD synthetase [Bacteroidota bacterium]